jgi:hypothetical protein
MGRNKRFSRGGKEWGRKYDEKVEKIEIRTYFCYTFNLLRNIHSPTKCLFLVTWA